MKKNYLFIITLLVLGAVSITACKDKKDKPTDEVAEEAGKAPYTVTLDEVNSDFAPALQSFVWANMGAKVLMFGGRTNGFHTFDDYNSTFPPKRNNTYFYVMHLDSSRTDSLPIPKKYFYQLRSTNMEFYQDGNTLYCLGGYGSNSDTTNGIDSTYKTYANLFTIDINAAIAAVSKKDASALEKSIKMAPDDERMRVTGGELRKVDDWFYLVFGQNFKGAYSDGATGVYTQEVRRFKIDNSGAVPMITDYSAQMCSWDDSSFHRRDLVVAETFMKGGKRGVTAYGGVFTPLANLAYQTPVYIQDDNGTMSITTDSNFLQKFCLYAAPEITLYDAGNDVMYTTILGGISQYHFDSEGKLVNGGGDMPFTQNITTVVRDNKTGKSVEYPQENPTLPGFLGAEAIFIHNYTITPLQGSSRILDYSATSQGDDKGYMIGYMFGGILSNGTTSSATNPTVASNKIYKVYFKK